MQSFEIKQASKKRSARSAPMERMYTKAEVTELIKDVIVKPPKLTHKEKMVLKKDYDRRKKAKEEPDLLASEPSLEEKQITTTPEPRRKRLRFRRHTPERYEEKEDIPDVVEEQVSSEYTTVHCPEAVTDMKEVKRSPEDYLEVNVIKKSRVVDTFALPIDKKKFHYKKFEYNIEEEGIFLLPTKSGMLMPTAFYREGKPSPSMFKNSNKGITGKALSLLYTEQLYTSLLYSEDTKYNLAIVLLLIGCLVAFGIGCYFVFFHAGGMFPQPLPPINQIP